MNLRLKHRLYQDLTTDLQKWLLSKEQFLNSSVETRGGISAGYMTVSHAKCKRTRQGTVTIIFMLQEKTSFWQKHYPSCLTNIVNREISSSVVSFWVMYILIWALYLHKELQELRNVYWDFSVFTYFSHSPNYLLNTDWTSILLSATFWNSITIKII